MALKFADSLLGIVDSVCKSHKRFLRKSQFSYYMSIKARFCSKNDENNSTPLSNEAKLKTLLNSSSPLRSTVDEDEWATSPYPVGTVFQDVETDTPVEKKPSKDSNRAIILFPGQGNQFVGMGKNLMKYSTVVDMFGTANKILKYDLQKICFDGPEKVLNDTKYCQPATFVCSLALLEKLKDERPWAINNCVATCGYSLGELTALVFAGCINFETGLKLVDFRAKAMAKCCEKTPGGMLTIFTGPHTTLGEAFSSAIEHCRTLGIENPVCGTACYLLPNCKVIAGNSEALDFLTNNASKFGIKRHSKLPVSGAFHTSLMKEAADSFAEKLEEIQFNKPLIKVFSNVTALPYKSSKQMKKLLAKQIYYPVKWEQTVHNIFSSRKGVSYPYVYECGPGNSLITSVTKINRQATPTCYAIQL